MCKKICNNIIVYFAVVSLIFIAVPVSFAQEMAPETMPEAPEELPAEPAGPPEPAEKATTPGNVTIDFKDADILNVLRILSIKSGVNIVAGKDVEGTVTIRLVDVPWEKALDVVLKTYGFAYEREENIIRVATVENLGQEPLKTDVFRIKYAKAEEIAESIKEMITARGSIRADKRSNTLIVTDIPTNIYKIEQVLARLDEPTPQVYIEARVIETTLDDDEKLGIDWDVKVTADGSTIPTTVPFNKNMLPSHMPYLEGKIADSFIAFANGDYTFGTLNFNEFQAVLWMLNERTDTKIVSNPRMVTLNNQEATIHIGDTLYTPEWSESATTGTPVFSGITKTDLATGVKLKVTPHVNSKEEIVVDLEPEVSTFPDSATTLLTTDSGTVNAWKVSIRTAKTQVMVKDGETIAIGGLLKETTVKTRRKVPFLGDIPLLGYLFRYSEDTIDTRDLLIFVTVKLIETKEDAEPYLKEITERMDEFEHAPEAVGHQWEPDTPIGSGKSKKKSTRLIVE